MLGCLSDFQTIQKLLEIAGDAETTFTVGSLGINAISFSVMFFLSYGIATPGGIFMPSLMVRYESKLI